jgi:growth hormone-inducible transmembrane protein
MSLLLRRPLAARTAIFKAPSQLIRPARQLHQSHSPLSRSVTPLKSSPLLSSARNAFKRHYATPPPNGAVAMPTASGSLMQRLLYGGAIFGGTLLAINLVFNRETREDGGMPPFERAYLNDTFLHTGLGLSIIAIAARTLHASGWSVRLMATNPWLVMGGGLVLSIGSMYGCMATDPKK